MARKNNDYFELIKKQTACCVEAAELLENVLCVFDAGHVREYKEQM